MGDMNMNASERKRLEMLSRVKKRRSDYTGEGIGATGDWLSAYQADMRALWRRRRRGTDSWESRQTVKPPDRGKALRK